MIDVVLLAGRLLFVALLYLFLFAIMKTGIGLVRGQRKKERTWNLAVEKGPKELRGVSIVVCGPVIEDLLVPTALALTGEESAFIASEDELNRRYHDIYEMEAEATRTGMRIVKVCLVVSYREQGKRLAERLERADKQWKFSMGDLDTRTHWDSYQAAYSEVLRRTSTRVAPWYVVPADHKWYARLAVQELLVRTLEDVDPQWPAADFDVDEAKRRLATTTSPEALRLHSDEHLAAARVAAKGERGTDDHIAVEAMSPLTDFVP